MNGTDTKRLFLSRFLRVFEKNELVALVHLLQPEPVYLFKKNWRDIASCIDAEVQLDNNILSELITRKILITDIGVDKQILKETREQALRALNRPTILYLMMAQGCNFACTYCPIPTLAKRYGEHLLSFEDAVSGIALWQKHIIEEQPQDNDPYFLIFYGGEPLLNREVLERLLPYVAEEQSAGRLPKKLKLMLCTTVRWWTNDSQSCLPTTR